MWAFFRGLIYWAAMTDVAEQFALAEETLAEAWEEHSRRRARQAVRLAHLACFRAGAALSRVVGSGPIRLDGDQELNRVLSRSAPKNLAAFYHRLSLLKRRLDNDQISQLHVEEAANWLRQSGQFIDRLARLAARWS